jgi:tRNA pseudouridine38-40 synthase
MTSKSSADKGRVTQFLVQLGYLGTPFYGVTPQHEGPCVWHALLARVADSLGPLVPYAISWAARTDRGVHAHANWVSFRLRQQGRLPVPVTQILAALGTARYDDGLRHVVARVMPHRVMARSLTEGKTYRYVVPAVQGAPVHAIRVALTYLNGRIHVGRLAHPRALTPTTQLWRTAITVDMTDGPADGALTFTFTGQGFLRRQIRYMVGALIAVRDRDWRPEDVAFLTQGNAGPLRRSAFGPAPSDGLTLVAHHVSTSHPFAGDS